MNNSTTTRIIKIDPQQPDQAVIRMAADCLRNGGLVAFPTETVYGLGANAHDAAAVSHIFEAKGRPAHNPLIVHIAALTQLAQVTSHVPEIALQLAESFWPGALTFVLPRGAAIPPNVSAGGDTVAVRMPSHPVALNLITAAGVPIAAPSANRFTRPSATTAAHVAADLDGRVEIILDGGATPIGLESTVLDLTGERPVVLRPGGITLDALRSVLPDVALRSALLATETPGDEIPASPGMLTKHYSPRAEVLLFDGNHAAVSAQMAQTAQRLINEGKRVGVLLTTPDERVFDDLDVERIALSTEETNHALEIMGQHLFSTLRDFDTREVDVILVRQVEKTGLGMTIADRLLRAADGRVIEVE